MFQLTEVYNEFCKISENETPHNESTQQPVQINSENETPHNESAQQPVQINSENETPHNESAQQMNILKIKEILQQLDQREKYIN